MSDLDNEGIEATKKLQEKTADEMFEELGLVKIQSSLMRNEFCIQYKKGIGSICFHKEYKTVEIYMHILSMQELQAINKKVSELGWLDD